MVNAASCNLQEQKELEIKPPGKWDWLQEFFEPMRTCPLCEGLDWRLQFAPAGLKVWRCEVCKLLFLNPYLKPEGMKKIFSSPELLKRVSEFFSDYYKENSWNTPRTLGIYRNVLNEIERFKPTRGKVLDIGCGRGAFLKLAHQRGWRASGVEPNFNDAEPLRQEYGIEVFQCDFLEAKIPEGVFDVVSLWDLIEHVPNPKEWLKRCSQLLKSKGLLVIATPNHFSLLDLLAAWAYRLTCSRFTYALEKLYTIDHTLYLTQKTLGDLLEKENFRPLQFIKVNTDLSRYSMNPAFRLFTEILLLASRLLHLENRIIAIAEKG